MKNLIVVLMLLNSFSVLACSTLEAQFIGSVKEVVETEEGCTVKLDDSFDYYAIHGLCPLFQEELTQKSFLSKSCRYKAGDQVSGVAVLNVESDLLTIE